MTTPRPDTFFGLWGRASCVATALAFHLKPAAKSVATATAAALKSGSRSPCATLVGAGARGPAERRVPELCPGAQEGVMKEERSSFWGASGTLGVRLDQHWHIVAKRVRILGLECKTKRFLWRPC